MYARVKEDARFVTITSCGGFEFSKKEFRPVPAGCEAEAGANTYLDVTDDEEILPESPVVESQVPPEAVEDLELFFVDDVVISDEVDATDSAIALAQEYEIDLSDVNGSGSGGRILKSDVQDLLSEEES